jgi:hypothetical protein
MPAPAGHEARPPSRHPPNPQTHHTPTPHPTLLQHPPSHPHPPHTPPPRHLHTRINTKPRNEFERCPDHEARGPHPPTNSASISSKPRPVYMDRVSHIPTYVCLPLEQTYDDDVPPHRRMQTTSTDMGPVDRDDPQSTQSPPPCCYHPLSSRYSTVLFAGAAPYRPPPCPATNHQSDQPDQPNTSPAVSPCRPADRPAHPVNTPTLPAGQRSQARDT